MLNKTPMIIRAGTGDKATLEATVQGWAGELAMCTDSGNEGKLLICPATESGFVNVVAGSNPPDITGSRANTEAALANLLTALAALGLITDSTTA